MSAAAELSRVTAAVGLEDATSSPLHGRATTCHTVIEAIEATEVGRQRPHADDSLPMRVKIGDIVSGIGQRLLITIWRPV